MYFQFLAPSSISLLSPLLFPFLVRVAVVGVVTVDFSLALTVNSVTVYPPFGRLSNITDFPDWILTVRGWNVDVSPSSVSVRSTI